jgi:hypothetical protein
MANSILDSHMPTSSNTILTSHGWPNNTSGNAPLVSHGDPYVEGGGGGGFSAVLNTGTGVMTITGSGFGSKSGPGPLFFQPFTTGVTHGMLASNPAVGLDFVYPTAIAGSSPPAITTSVGIGGGSIVSHCLSLTLSNDDWLSHIGIDLSPTQQEIFVSQWNRLDLVAGTPDQTIQMKGIRSGQMPSPDDGERYGTIPRSAGSTWVPPNGVWNPNDNQSSYLASFNSSGVEIGNFGPGHNSTVAPYDVVNTSGEAVPFSNPPFTGWGQWWQQEIHHKMNTYGSDDGFMSLRLNGKERVRVSHWQPALITGRAFGWVNFQPLLDHTAGANIDTHTSRIYVDNTPKRVFLGNAATLGDCTGRFLLPPTDWGDGSITCSNCTNIPAGYEWVYVMDENDAEIDSGSFSTV